PVGYGFDIVSARDAYDIAAADALEPELAQHARRRPIVDEVRGGEPRQLARMKSVADDGLGRLGGVAAAPPWAAEPEAEFGSTRAPAVVSRTADQPSLQLDGKPHLAAAGLEPGHGLRLRQRIGDVARHGRNGPLAREPRELGCITVPEGPQEQTLGSKRNHEQSVAAREGLVNLRPRRAVIERTATRRPPSDTPGCRPRIRARRDSLLQGAFGRRLHRDIDPSAALG